MTGTIWASLITAAALLGSGLIAALVTVGLAVWRSVQRARKTNEALWLYTRDLIDHIYRGGLGPPPAPPEYIRHIYEPGDDQ
ncbi:hypothetical protein ACFPZL_01185 [Leucobacter soli]|uniref:Uncharacterized protein n=1 Tax=Leucobacter soli TaxID=2812850 RepID=A0A916K0V5_9MICO|nr:hypothetical protein [Leucobacter soli]CAG7618516.1 hypothetical protein LEUCIP111803_02211 [Leucobacter soli]